MLEYNDIPAKRNNKQSTKFTQLLSPVSCFRKPQKSTKEQLILELLQVPYTSNKQTINISDYVLEDISVIKCNNKSLVVNQSYRSNSPICLLDQFINNEQQRNQRVLSTSSISQRSSQPYKTGKKRQNFPSKQNPLPPPSSQQFNHNKQNMQQLGNKVQTRQQDLDEEEEVNNSNKNIKNLLLLKKKKIETVTFDSESPIIIIKNIELESKRFKPKKQEPVVNSEKSKMILQQRADFRCTSVIKQQELEESQKFNGNNNMLCQQSSPKPAPNYLDLFESYQSDTNMKLREVKEQTEQEDLELVKNSKKPLDPFINKKEQISAIQHKTDDDEYELQRYILDDLKSDISNLKDKMTSQSRLIPQTSFQLASDDQIDYRNLKDHIEKLRNKIFTDNPFL